MSKPILKGRNFNKRYSIQVDAIDVEAGGVLLALWTQYVTCLSNLDRTRGTIPQLKKRQQIVKWL